MSERKVLNKYYPPDYDPSKIPKGKRNKNATFNIRIMAPFNMRCNMCKEYIYKGKKFNSRKEDVMDEDYLGLKIFRFYIKCPRCVSEIAFKTDLQNTDYTLEAGAKRLFEAEKIAQQMAEEERKAKEEEEMNPMKLLENRTKASRQEMDQIDTLEELRELNTRKNLVNTDEMIEKYRKYEEMLQQLQMEKEEEEINEIFGDKSGKVVKRLNDSDSEEEEPSRKKAAIMDPAARPTDILAGVSKEEAKPKPARVWEKSVGGISSKQKLKGLVAVKKKPTLPTATVSKSPGSNSNSNSNMSNSDTGDKSDNDPVSMPGQSFAAPGSNEGKSDSSEIESSQINRESNDRSNENAVRNQNGVKSNEHEIKSGDKVAENKDAKVNENAQVAVTNKPAGSGLLALGAYSDSESDTSE